MRIQSISDDSINVAINVESFNVPSLKFLYI